MDYDNVLHMYLTVVSSAFPPSLNARCLIIEKVCT